MKECQICMKWRRHPKGREDGAEDSAEWLCHGRDGSRRSAEGVKQFVQGRLPISQAKGQSVRECSTLWKNTTEGEKKSWMLY